MLSPPIGRIRSVSFNILYYILRELQEQNVVYIRVNNFIYKFDKCKF